MLGVQLYDLISQAGLKQEQVVRSIHSCRRWHGCPGHRHRLSTHASEDSDPAIYQHGASPLESLSFGPNGKADIILKNLGETDRLMAFRYHDLILLKITAVRTSRCGGDHWCAAASAEFIPASAF